MSDFYGSTRTYLLTGQEWVDELGTIWRETDRVCGVCDMPLWTLDGRMFSGYCANGHRCALTDEWCWE